MRFNCLKTTEPLQGDSLLFIAKSPGPPGTYLMNLEGRKGKSNLESTSGFEDKAHVV